jgi:type IV pilus assembly protein PilO
MDLSELNDLDFNNAGSWPAPAKIISLIVVAAVVCGLWYSLDTKDQLEKLETMAKEETTLKSQFQRKQKKVANLDALKRQLTEMEEMLGALLRQLPKSTEVEALLVDVSQTGLASGLEFELFDPQAEVKKEFYAELPIKLKVTGKYHEFGNFVSGLAVLPRIVTIHNIKIKGNKNHKNAGDDLTMEAVAKTYRYLEDEE